MFINISFYSFFPLSKPESLSEAFLKQFKDSGTLGTLLIAHEGLNMNLAFPNEALMEDFKNFLKSWGLNDVNFKLSYTEGAPFKKLKALVKKEICKLGVEDLNVKEWEAPHMPAEEFRAILESPEASDYLILDNRNEFEFKMGTFKGAQHLGMKKFTEFPEITKQIENKHGVEKKIIMFCTGGIRCEKAGSYMRSKGFRNVWQVEGGILKYFEKEGSAAFEGHCFVFDNRGYVDPDLKAYNDEGAEFPEELVELTISR